MSSLDMVMTSLGVLDQLEVLGLTLKDDDGGLAVVGKTGDSGGQTQVWGPLISTWGPLANLNRSSP